MLLLNCLLLYDRQGIELCRPVLSGVIKLFSCSTQLSTKFHLLIKTKIPTNEEVSCFKPLRCCIYHANTRGDQKVRGKVLLHRIAFTDCNENS